MQVRRRLRHVPGVAGWAYATPFSGIGNEEIMATFRAARPGKTRPYLAVIIPSIDRGPRSRLRQAPERTGKRLVRLVVWSDPVLVAGVLWE